MELLFSSIAVMSYLLSAIRILSYENHSNTHKRKHEILAVMLIASFMGQAVNIIFLKDPVTVWDAFFGLILFVVIWKSEGNVAQLFRKKSA
ncbi:phage holin family protein [Acinetobacter pollinis]|jgi:hypothetical protein|uniref:Phage holin family protein n=1 Tax=Acinetobacter pollinis TaxID=2605270 RepID=A0ABU6DUN9_9GAMM|nr:phage holin family protein [Acinetobacter pollinis]MBF7690833.1 phage holin family protein [Acinetobacter pollinis]MBF7698478.1 phage holin family protein [Acinetobacter pollinis]MEB5477581.1 phage holin family protein [Acinetobacter pollinis]